MNHQNLLIAGLGNPGAAYKNTKHNIGEDSIHSLSFSSDLNWQKKFKGEISQHKNNYFIVPQTFMNLSGQCIAPAANFYKITADRILILHDELDLPFGTIALKFGGGLAGHNGLKSIASDLGTQDFFRLRIGIGRPLVGSVSDWVLSRFVGDDLLFYPQYLLEISKVVEEIINEGFTSSQKKYTKKKLIN